MGRTQVAAAVIVALVAAAGCGRKSPPLPPIIEYPETTRDLTVYQEGDEAVLEWSYPQLTRAGRQLTDLWRVEVWRLDVPPGQEHPVSGPSGEEMQRQMMLARGRLLARLEGESLEQATRGDRLQFRDQLDVPGPGGTRSTFWYAVRSRRRDGTPSGLSNIVAWQPQPIPPQVSGLSATVSRDGILLSWEPIEGAGYVVQRRPDPASPWEIISPPGVVEPEYFDTAVRTGTTWYYRVRTLINDTVSPPDVPLEVHFPDVYPPEEVTGFICLPEPARVRLQWDRVPEPGVRYIVFRRPQGEQRWTQLVRHTSMAEFVDEEPPKGLVEYAVKAVDEAGNESEAVYCAVRIAP